MTIADVCDLAEAALVERYEGDARAERAFGAERSVDEARAELYERLYGEREKLRAVDRHTADLERALGVA